MSTVESSAVRKAVVQCTSDLTSLLKHHLSCSGKLLEKGLITEAVHSYVLTAQGVSTLEKAARLVSCLADRVGAVPGAGSGAKGDRSFLWGHCRQAHFNTQYVRT